MTTTAGSLEGRALGPGPLPDAPPRLGAGIRVTQARVIRSEWLKLRTLRSTWYTLLAAVVGMVGIGSLVCWAINNRWHHLSPVDRLTFNPVMHSLVGVFLAQLAVGVLGVLVVTGEYGTGMIRATLGAVPRRLPVLWAKLVVYLLVTWVVGLIASFGSFEAGQALLGAHGTNLGYPDVWRAILGAAGYLTLVGAFALGLGFAIRSTAGGIAALFGLLLILPGLANALPSSWQGWVLPYLPSEAGRAMWSLQRESPSLHPWAGLGVFCAWVAGAVILGAWVLKRRDA